MIVCTVYVVVLRLQVLFRSGRKRRRRKEAPSIPRTTDRGPDWDDANTLALWSGALSLDVSFLLLSQILSAEDLTGVFSFLCPKTYLTNKISIFRFIRPLS